MVKKQFFSKFLIEIFNINFLRNFSKNHEKISEIHRIVLREINGRISEKKIM